MTTTVTVTVKITTLIGDVSNMRRTSGLVGMNEKDMTIYVHATCFRKKYVAAIGSAFLLTVGQRVGAHLHRKIQFKGHLSVPFGMTACQSGSAERRKNVISSFHLSG